MHTLEWVVEFLPILCFPMLSLMGCFGFLGLSTFLLAYGIYKIIMLVCASIAVVIAGAIALCVLFFCFRTTRGLEETKPVKWNPPFDFEKEVLQKSIVKRYCLLRILCGIEIRMLRILKDPQVLYHRLLLYWQFIGFLNAGKVVACFGCFNTKEIDNQAFFC